MKNILVLFSLFVFTPLFNNVFSQIQVGSDILGAEAGDGIGSSVALSANGQRLAIGAPISLNDEDRLGVVHIYEWNNEAWSLLGNEIVGQQAYDFLGESVAFSSDGNIIAIGCIANTGVQITGHVEVYELLNGSWIQMGDDINGEADGDHFGQSLSLSADGSRLVSGAIYNNESTGQARVFEWLNESWIQMGSDIDGETIGDWFGGSVSISADGTRVAVGATHNDGNGDTAGHVRTYEWSGGSWIQMGSDIDGVFDYDLSGKSVSLSPDGNRLALGARINLEGTMHGVVRVHEWVNDSWSRLGDDINGAAQFDDFGITTSFGANGNRLAISSIFNNSVQIGYVELYELSDEMWVQVGNTINGVMENSSFGLHATISAEGNHVAIGVPRSDANGEWSGHVEVYEFSTITATEQHTTDNIEIYPNPANSVLYIMGDDIETVGIINGVGQLVKMQNKLSRELDISELPSGIYFISLLVNNVYITKKFIKI